jgi:hypothetical protein
MAAGFPGCSGGFPGCSGPSARRFEARSSFLLVSGLGASLPLPDFTFGRCSALLAWCVPVKPSAGGGDAFLCRFLAGEGVTGLRYGYVAGA